ncbi:MAG: amidohydrolase [Desulfobacteraceae bacterium]|nr:amidohydrolase [Desulfobacteraceae bacterium]MBC2720583.1 amidohydrolase [Desulfobacteraceae bacterium]
MIIDFHTHIFPEKIRENREKYFPDEPAFKLLYSSPKSKVAGIKDIVDSMDIEGVDKSVVFGFPWRNSDLSKKHNDYILEAVDRFPKRLAGFCCVDPFNKDAVPEVVRCLEGGLSGIGEIAFYQSGIDEASQEKLKPLMEICEDKNLPVLIHTNEPVGHFYPGKTPNTLEQIYSLVKKFSNNKIVLAHWGGGMFFFNLLKKEVGEYLNNVYFDTAASPFLYYPQIYQIAIQIIGKNKILFGSDFPLLKPAKYFKEFEKAGLSKDEIESISGNNAARLLCLHEPAVSKFPK